MDVGEKHCASPGLQHYGLARVVGLWVVCLKAFATASAQGFGIGAVAVVSTLVFLAVIAVPVVLVSGMLTSRRTKPLP